MKPFSVLSAFVLALIRLYQKMTWFLPGVCRYFPSCSHYMHRAIEQYGFIAGSWMGIKRLARCHPLHPGGLDPVPSLISPKLPST